MGDGVHWKVVDREDTKGEITGSWGVSEGEVTGGGITGGGHGYSPHPGP